MRLSADPQRLAPEKRVQLFRALDFLQKVGLLVIVSGFFALLLTATLIISRGVPARWQTLTIPRTPSIELTEALLTTLETAAIAPISAPTAPADALVELGKTLFFDTTLSGNRDLSCASCHHPLLDTADSSPVAIGPNGYTQVNVLDLTARHALNTLNWDGAVSAETTDDDLLATHALIHLADRDIMRGNNSAIGSLPDDAYDGIWRGVALRLTEIEAYPALFAAAFPDEEVIAPAQIGRALAAYQRAHFSTPQTDWDKFIDGERDALSDAEKRGALVFYGKARCATCHAGTLFTDGRYHNIAVPQIGEEVNFGRYAVTNDPRDYFSFRTPPLRNVALTPPYMHNGTYQTLRDAVRHHLDAQDMLNGYDPTHLPESLAETLKTDGYTYRLMARTLSDYAVNPPLLTGAEFEDLLAFLNALTDVDGGRSLGALP